MAAQNGWGAPRIHAELLKLGFLLSERTVLRFMPKKPERLSTHRCLTRHQPLTRRASCWALARRLPAAPEHATRRLIPPPPPNSDTISTSCETGFGTALCACTGASRAPDQFWRSAGAQFLVNITNHSWFEDTNAPYMNLQSSVFRAVESRRFLVHAANTSLSSFIDKKGRV